MSPVPFFTFSIHGRSVLPKISGPTPSFLLDGWFDQSMERDESEISDGHGVSHRRVPITPKLANGSHGAAKRQNIIQSIELETKNENELPKRKHRKGKLREIEDGVKMLDV